MSAVIAHARFFQDGNQDALDALKEAGVEVKTDTGFDDLELPEPQPGDRQIGHLTDQQRQLFVAYYDAAGELEDVSKNTAAGELTKLAAMIREGKDMPSGLSEMLTEDDAKILFRLSRHVEMLRSVLFWQIGEAFEGHDMIYGVRSKGRVVITGRKW